MAAKKELDIGFVLGLLTTLVVSWIYINDTIVELGIKDPINDFLFPLSILHYIIFVFAISTILLLYIYGLKYSNFNADNDARFKSLANLNHQFLFKYWLPVLLISLLSFAVSLTATKDYAWLFAFLIIVVLAILLFALFGKGVKFLFDALKPIPLLLLFFGYFIYLPAMCLFSANVEVKMDKEFYTSKDTALISIERKGYIFLPQVFNITFSGDTLYKANPPSNFKLPLNKKEIINMPFFEIGYSPQIFEITKKKYTYVKVAHNSSS